MKKIQVGDKMNYWETKDMVNSLIDQVNAQRARIIELEEEIEDTSQILAAIKEIREYLRDNTDFWPIVKLEGSR